MDLGTIEDFRKAVDFFADVYELNDVAKELVYLEHPEVARQILDDGLARETLRMLCPEANVRFEIGGEYSDSFLAFVIKRPSIGFILPPLMLLRRFVNEFNATEHLYADGKKVVIGNSGLTDPAHAYIEDLTIGPDTPEEHYRYIIDIINAMSGLDLDYHEFIDAVEIAAKRKYIGRDKKTHYK